MNTSKEFAKVKNKANPISQMLSDKKLRKAYYTHFRNSQRRGIEFNLSYEEWLTIWLYSGKLHLRGKHPGQFCMGRKGDKGAYEVGNVEIIGIEQNTHDGHIGKKKTISHRRKLKKHLADVRKRVAVNADGVIYPSLTDAARAFGVTPQCISVRIRSKSPRWAGWKVERVTRGNVKTLHTNNVIQFPTAIAADMDLSVDLTMDEIDPIDYAALARGEL